MAKVKIQDLENSERKRITEEFTELILCLKNTEEMADVLIGLMTQSEVLMFARRIQIAKEILRGGTQDEIRRKLKVGFNNMQSVDEWLHTDNPKRDRWLAKEILKLQLTEPEKRVFSKSGLDRYPEHRMMRQLLSKFIS